MPADPRANWRNPRVLLVLFLVFLCGSLAGALTMKYAVSRDEPRSYPLAYWTAGGKQLTLQHFEEELDLTPEQAREIELILDDFMMYYHTLQAQMDEVRATGKSRILRVLNPEQQKRFKQMLKDAPVRQTY